MSGTYIVNAAPMVIDLGTQDLSTAQIPALPESLPQHLPKFYLYAQKGPTTPQLVVGASRINTYGAASFDLLGPYANHATALANLIDAQGNQCMIQRVVPTDAGPPANFLLSLDILPVTVDVYERNSDGSLTLNSNGSPIPTGATTAGYNVKWVVSNQNTISGLNAEFGNATIVPGDQTNTTTNVQSQRYPIFEFQAGSQGSYGNLCGIRMWAPLANNPSFPSTMFDTLRAYPYNFAMVQSASANVSPSIVPTILNDQQVMTTLLPNSIDPTTGAQLYVGNVLIQSYQNLNDPTYPPVYGNFSMVAIYQNNINTVLNMFYAAELPNINAFSDITSNPQDMYMMNIASFTSSQGAPYTAIVPVMAANSVTMSQYTNVMAGGASDGTMNDTLFGELVATEVAAYLDPNSSVQDIAMNPESIIYDTGFPLATKQAMCSFVGLRHDTFVVLSTYDVLQPQLTQDQEMSTAIALRTRLQMFPESSYFGTGVMRGMVVGYSGTLLNSQYSTPVPLTFEIGIKSAIYMGASNGAWKTGYNFSGAPGSILQYVVNPTISWLPGTVRNKAWGAGLNWVQTYDRKSCFFPALKTVYDDDTSVLNSYFTAMAICTLNKIAHAAWREFSGVDNLTNAQLADKVNSFISNNTQGIFDGKYVIVPQAFFTDSDVARGYSWTLPIKLYANNMKTVMTTYTQAYRMSSLPTTNA